MKKHLANPHWTIADRVFVMIGTGSVFALLIGWAANNV